MAKSLVPRAASPHRLAAARRGEWLGDPLVNKGTAYSRDERLHLELEGLLPPRVESLEEQTDRVIENVRAKTSALERYCYLGALQCENETLFYRVVLDHLEEMLPIIYTPTVGQACVEWSRIYERPRGLYISAAIHRGRVAEVLRHWPRDRVGILVVTDGGRILGLGDLGANGMGIPIGKLSLYTACAGVPPDLCLPVVLDVGTDNEPLRNDPRYLGGRSGRMTGEVYDALIEEFVAATQAVFPGVILQFEDFNNSCAFRLLHRYRNQVCCFNDDVQGTGAMGLAGLYAAGRVTRTRLADQRLLFVGAGEACLGIGSIVTAAMQREGLSEADAKRHCLFMDSRGVVTTGRVDLTEHKRPFAQDRAQCRAFWRLWKTSGRPRSSAPAVRALCSRNRSSRRWRVSTTGQSYSRCPIRHLRPSAPLNKRMNGPTAARSSPAAARSSLSRLPGARTRPGRRTTPTSFLDWDSVYWYPVRNG